MELPRALMPWAEWLDLFPAELIAPIGELIRRLDLAIGPLRAPNQPGQGEPDGFDGIARRGDYDRLLLSEWLLADEAPDEFLRRAIMSEHVFLEPARIAPAGARCSVALFDAGPNQMGAPRLAHLAALIVLARRAQAAGAQFQWGLLQEEGAALHLGVTRTDLIHLLKARSVKEVRDEDIANWRAQAHSLVGMEDCWLIGGARLQTFPSAQGARLLQISDPLDPEAQYLTIQITQQKEIRLPLPTSEMCVRLLREPFHTRVAETRRVKTGRRPISNLVYISENRIVAKVAPERIVVFSPPKTPTGNLAKPKLYSSPINGNVLAVGKVGKGIALVTTIPNKIFLCISRVGPQSGKALTGTFDWPFSQIPPHDSQDALSLCHFMHTPTGAGYWDITLNHVQLQVTASDDFVSGELTARAMRPHLAFDPVLYGSHLIGLDMKGVRMALQPLLPVIPRIPRPDEETYAEFPVVRAAYYGYGGFLAHSAYGLWALETAPGQWKILHQDDAGNNAQTEVFVEPHAFVVGVVVVSGIESAGYGPYKYAPALVTLDPNRRTLTVQGNSWQRSEPPVTSPIEHITVSPYEPNVAYVTERGEVVVYSLNRQTALYRLDTEARI